MNYIYAAGGILAAVIIVAAFFFICKSPARILAKLLANTLLGFITLIPIQLLGGFIGVSIGLNWVNALIIGIFGFPGAALLVLIQWLTNV